MKTINKRHKKALELKHKMEDVYTKHEKHIKEQEERKFKTPASKKRSEEAFQRREAVYEFEEDKAYRNYYEHMHKDFSNRAINKNMTNKKYKDGFCDEKFINDMYASKLNKGEKNAKRTQPGKKKTK